MNLVNNRNAVKMSYCELRYEQLIERGVSQCIQGRYRDTPRQIKQSGKSMEALCINLINLGLWRCVFVQIFKTVVMAFLVNFCSEFVQIVPKGKRFVLILAKFKEL